MEKCFLGLGFGAMMSLTYFISNVTRCGVDWANCLAGSLEWLLTGAFLTACAMAGYALCLLCERLRDRRK